MFAILSTVMWMKCSHWTGWDSVCAVRPIRTSASNRIEVASIPSTLCARFDRTGLMWIVSGLTRSTYGR